MSRLPPIYLHADELSGESLGLAVNAANKLGTSGTNWRLSGGLPYFDSLFTPCASVGYPSSKRTWSA
jgi:hypothetical protein